MDSVSGLRCSSGESSETEVIAKHEIVHCVPVHVGSFVGSSAKALDIQAESRTLGYLTPAEVIESLIMLLSLAVRRSKV